MTPAGKNDPSEDALSTIMNDHPGHAHSKAIIMTAASTRPKRKRVTKPEPLDDGWDVLPHGMGNNYNLKSDPDDKSEESQPKKKRATTKKVSGDTTKKEKHPYGLTPGESPFPDHVMPTPEACEGVHRLLKALHDPEDKVKPPKEIPPPSMEVTGCGEVPDLLDALLRTMLSAATSRTNSNMSINGLGEKFGRREVGLGKGSINWDAIHAASFSEVFDAIKRGGLAKVKTANIKAILDIVYKRNTEIRDALLKERETGETAAGLGAKYETQEQKDAQLARFEETLLAMDYVFEMTSDEAMDEMTKLPGVGVKTASCVILFNMQRPSFAVDTHVWRHCKWLGWVPENADRDKTFSHCEVRVPDHLKYALHQLFIRHGSECGRCKANTSPGSEEFQNTVCPLEHLVKRTGKRKVVKIGDKSTKAVAKRAVVKKGAKGKDRKVKKIKYETEESDSEEADEKSEHPDDDED